MSEKVLLVFSYHWGKGVKEKFHEILDQRIAFASAKEG